MKTDLKRKLAGEFLGSLFLLAIVVGSGIMGERLSGGNTAIALLANSIATGFGLVVLIWIFGPISGAHFNPIVTGIINWQEGRRKQETTLYFLAQVLGAVAGVAVAHAMFAEDLIALSSKERGGLSQLVSEFVATFGLVMVIRGLSRQEDKIPFAVGAYIAAAYWFTASTSFANPAVTLARALTPTFAGISLHDVGAFVIAQILGGVTADLVFRWFLRGSK